MLESTAMLEQKVSVVPDMSSEETVNYVESEEKPIMITKVFEGLGYVMEKINGLASACEEAAKKLESWLSEP